jgi:hypothetical protein
MRLPALVLLLLGMVFLRAHAAEEKPLPRFAPEKLTAALEDASLIFEGEVVEADLEPGIFPGNLGVHCKRVVYEVTDPVKGSFGKQVETWFLLVPGEVGGDYLDAEGLPKSILRLDPKLFAKGSTHLVCCLNEKGAVGKWKDWFKLAYGEKKPGERNFALLITPNVKDAKAKAKAKVEGGPGK